MGVENKTSLKKLISIHTSPISSLLFMKIKSNFKFRGGGGGVDGVGGSGGGISP
jgi:hypothetical protein